MRNQFFQVNRFLERYGSIIKYHIIVIELKFAKFQQNNYQICPIFSPDVIF